MPKSFVLSTDEINSYGFIVVTEGISTERFSANPVMLRDHDERSVVGRWENVRKENGQLIADPVFDVEDDDGKKLAGKVERGFLRGASIGFVPLQIEPEANGQPMKVTKSMLIEASVTAIPSNAGSLAMYDKSGRKVELSIENIKKLSFYSNPNEPMSKLNLIATALGLAGTATEDEVLAAAQNLSNMLKTAQDENKALKEAAQKQLNQTIDAMVQLAVDQKKITPAQKEDYVKLASKDFDSTKKILDAIKPAVNLAAAVQPGAQGNAEDRTTWTLSDYRKKDPEALAKLEKENPTEFNRLVENFKTNKV